jgi:putative protease
MDYEHVGIITHYFDRLGVAVVQLNADLYLEDWILIEGPRTALEQQVYSMQINRQPVDRGVQGEEVAIKVDDTVREGDEVYVMLQPA